ncbi:MAG: hypothetical protein ABFS42_06125 [Candidatus Krumholzibacteriota bacterium]
MRYLTLTAAVLMIALPFLALAQEESGSTEEVSILERVQKAAELITASKEAREAGIPEEEVAKVLKDARERGLSPRETEGILSESTSAVEESGPVDNFGGFVQAKLDEGLRGKELAAAIHAEHRQHGKGKGHGKQKDHPQGKKGGPGDARHDDDDEHDHDHDHGHNGDDDEDQGRGKGKQKDKGK